MSDSEITLAVASLPATREHVVEMSKKLGLTYPPSTEFVCMECEGKCFLSDGSYAGAKENADMHGFTLVILCETCAMPHIKRAEDMEFMISPQQIDELKNSRNV